MHFEKVKKLYETNIETHTVYMHLYYNSNRFVDKQNPLVNQCHTTRSELAKSLKLSESSVTRKINKLIDEGFIEYYYKSTSSSKKSIFNLIFE